MNWPIQDIHGTQYDVSRPTRMSALHVLWARLLNTEWHINIQDWHLIHGLYHDSIAYQKCFVFNALPDFHPIYAHFVSPFTAWKTGFGNGRRSPLVTGNAPFTDQVFTNKPRKVTGRCPLLIRHICNGYYTTTVTTTSHRSREN
jgi:hypothetical protein